MSHRDLLAHTRYRDGDGKFTPGYLRLRSGLPFPSYSENPDAAAIPRWMQIPGVALPCERLRAPRIRLAPGENVVRETILHDLQTKGKLEFSALDEEDRKYSALNLTGQNLGCAAQRQALLTMLAMNPYADTVNLSDNGLTDLSDVTLPLARHVFLANNALPSFASLPIMPHVETLCVSGNPIHKFDGLCAKRFPKLTKIMLDRCPVASDVDTLAFRLGSVHRGIEWMSIAGKYVHVGEPAE